ncbi:MAG: hypothetical protein FD147_2377 [Chloroflexi bacterium]|nr:MAG: hypothetical protein FD147_2377 [Chloroflexota bacterium]
MISLRAYNREIETLIDNGQYDEAIAHCKNILTTYPKCIDTYRNLGKTLLECKRYTEALDIFQRVLSVYPDDFISHVGLSIIYEDERDLDLAIWHMEQAFDVQPSNVAIQEELKRLFGRRDGVQPQKIRLTRGALVRMYARGELFQQAIAEIHSALAEDPKSINMEVVLAKMYFLSGLLVEAAEICNKIVEKIPFCFEANKILEEIFTKNGNIENATIFRNRLITLDPYYRFQSSPSNKAGVYDDKVVIDRLVYSPSVSSETSVPAWTKAVGVDWDEKQSNGNNDWLSNLGKDNEPASNETIPINPSSNSKSTLDESATPKSGFFPDSAQETDIPDWMKKAGWVPAESSTEPKSFSLSENISNDNSQVNQNTDTPDWLSSINSENISQQNGGTIPHGITTPDNSPDENTIPFNQTTEVDNLRQSLTDWKHEENMDNNDIENKTANGDGNSSPDWLSQFMKNEDKSENKTSDQDLPDWLKNFEQDQTVAENNNTDVPDWLKNLQTNQNAVPLTEGNVSQPNETIFSSPILENENAGPLIQDIPNELTTFENNDADTTLQPSIEIVTNLLNSHKTDTQIESDQVLPPLMPDLPNGWQNEISASQNFSETASSVESSTAVTNGIPDWVKSVLDTQGTIVEKEEDVKESVLFNQDDSQMSELPISDLQMTQKITSEHSEVGVISQQTNDELLEWLRGLKPEDDKLDFESSEVHTPESISFEEDDSSMESALDRLGDLSGSRISQPENAIEAGSSTSSGIDLESSIDENIPEMSKILHPDIDEVSSLFAHEITVDAPTLTVTRESVSETGEIRAHEKLPDILEKDPESIASDLSVEYFNELISLEEFEKIPGIFSDLVSRGNAVETLIDTLSLLSTNKESNYSYWQCLGDIYAQNSKLDDAILVYEKAEEILINTINS